jgi:FkbM family methyltransferase
MIKDILELIRPRVVFDCGAHIGTDSIEFAKDPKCRVYAFEILQSIYLKLIDNTIPYNNIHCFRMAVSDTDGGYRQIYESLGNYTESSSLQKPKNHLITFPHIKFQRKEFVETITIDSFCEQYGIEYIDVLWLDLQGHELKALLGARRMLAHTKYIHTECYSSEMYEGQPFESDFLHLLGDNWKLVKNDGNGNIILKNTLV